MILTEIALLESYQSHCAHFQLQSQVKECKYWQSLVYVTVRFVTVGYI